VYASGITSVTPRSTQYLGLLFLWSRRLAADLEATKTKPVNFVELPSGKQAPGDGLLSGDPVVWKRRYG